MTSTNTSPTSRPTLHRVALAQIAPLLADRQRNVGLHLEQIKAARAHEADLIVFPELSLTGYFVRDMVPDVAITPDAPEIRELLGRRRPDGRGAGLRRRVAATSLLQHGPVRRGRAGRPPAPQGLSADLRTVRRATLLRRRRTVRRLRYGPLRTDGHPDLRRFLAPFGRRHHAGRRDRRARSAPRTRLAAASRDRGSARPRPTSTCRRPTPN